MKQMIVWIEHNPATGSSKPWEIWYQVNDGKRTINASCETEENAKKSLAKMIKRNQPYYKIIVR